LLNDPDGGSNFSLAVQYNNPDGGILLPVYLGCSHAKILMKKTSSCLALSITYSAEIPMTTPLLVPNWDVLV
jgi:hypothetical protein